MGESIKGDLGPDKAGIEESIGLMAGMSVNCS
jgi:hypothetical protein